MATRKGLVFEQTFNTGSNLGSMGFVQEGNATGRVTDVGGQRAVSLTLNHYGDAVPIRTELQPTGLPDPYFSNGMHAKYGQTYWYGIKSMLPGNWRLDSAPESVMQWHDWPDAGEAWKNPPVALLIENKADGAHYTVHVRSDAKAMTPSSGTRYDSFKQYDLGKVADTAGKWTEWVWKIKWGYDSSGSLSLYKNGQEVLDLPNQGNAFNDQRGPYFKFGTYKWDWESSADTGAASRTKYFDDLRIAAGPGASYDSVAPAQQSAAKSGIAASMAFAAPEASEKVDAFAAAGETVTKNISYALGSGEDSLILTGTGAVTGTGNAHANMLSGNSAANILGGNAGDDRLSGNGGDDQLYGGGGKDHLNGGAGDDLLMGNDGKDVLVGASGADRFVFALASQTGTGETSRDKIVDFSHAQGDRIDLSPIDADSKALGNQSFAFIGSEGFSGAAGQLHATSYGGGLMVAGDLDGDKSADFQIELQGVSSLSAADFLL